MVKRIIQKIIENPAETIVKPTDARQPVFCMDADISGLKDYPFLFFPGGDLGVFKIFFKAADEYGFEINQDIFFESYKKILSPNLYLHKDQSSCFYFKNKDLQDNSFVFEENFLTKYFPVDQIIKTPVFKKTFSCLFIIEGEFLVRREIRLENNETYYSLIFNQTLFFRKLESLLDLLYRKKAIKTTLGQDKEFVREALFEIMDTLFWESIVPSFKGLPIRGLVIRNARLKKVKDLGIIRV